jgi:hypothetical protein
VVHGGEGPNRTVERILKESALAALYNQVQHMTEENFHHSKLTTAHTPPNMTTTYAALLAHMEKYNSHKYQPGRAADYAIKDFIDNGVSALHKIKNLRVSENVEHDDGKGGEGEWEHDDNYGPNGDLEPDELDLSTEIP